jgi:hypothetical protein
MLPEEYDDLADLTDDERRMLLGWASTYEKYPIVGVASDGDIR